MIKFSLNKLVGLSFLIAIIASTIGCHSHKLALESSEQLKEFVSGTNQKMVKSDFNLDHVSLKIKTSYKEGNVEQSFTMNVKMIRDSVIWASITGFGIEVARVLITKDSFKMIDRLRRQYIIAGVNQLKKYTHQDFSLKQLQDVLIGNSLFDSDVYKVKHDDLRLDHLFFQDSTLWNSLLLTQGYRIKMTELSNAANTQKASVTYDVFKKIKKAGSLPTNLNVDILSETRKMLLQMEYVTVSVDPIDNLSFTIPEKYAKGM